MNKALAFAALDFRLIKPYIKSMLLFPVLGVILSISLKSTSILETYFMVALLLMISYPFTIGEKNGLDILYGTLPLARRTVVLGRYLFVLALEIVLATSGLLCSWLLSQLVGSAWFISEKMAIVCVSSCVLGIIAAFQYPVYFKFGYTKARLVAQMPLLLVSLAVIRLPTLLKQIRWNTQLDALLTGHRLVLLYSLPVIAGLAALALSCAFSCRIYQGKDI
jgi:hypothetical protein